MAEQKVEVVERRISDGSDVSKELQTKEAPQMR